MTDGRQAREETTVRRPAGNMWPAAAVGYARGMGGKGTRSSLQQRQRITAFCAWHPPPLHMVVDEAPTAVGKPFADRPGGADVLTLLRAHVVNVVVVATLDRLFLTWTECYTYVEAWGQQEIRLHVLDFQDSTLSLDANTNVLFLATLAECLTMRNPDAKVPRPDTLACLPETASEAES